MRAELKYGLLFGALAIVISRFSIFPDNISGFLCGVFVALGIFLLVASLLPKNIYDNLLYRKLIADKKD